MTILWGTYSVKLVIVEVWKIKALDSNLLPEEHLLQRVWVALSTHNYLELQRQELQHPLLASIGTRMHMRTLNISIFIK